MIELFLFVFTNFIVVLLVVFIARGEKLGGAESLGLFAYKEELQDKPSQDDSNGPHHA